MKLSSIYHRSLSWTADGWLEKINQNMWKYLVPNPINWQMVDKEWWTDGAGSFIRKVIIYTGLTKYVGWRFGLPVLYYFDSLEAAKIAVENQGP